MEPFKTIKIMESLFKQIGEIIKKDIERDIKIASDLDLLRRVYNYWREQEHDGTEYIFSIFDKNDFKFVVDKEILDQYGIVWAVNNTDIGCFFFPSDVNNNDYQEVTQEDLKNMLINSLDCIIPNMFKFVARGTDTPYQELYEKYVVNRLIKVIY